MILILILILIADALPGTVLPNSLASLDLLHYRYISHLGTWNAVIHALYDALPIVPSASPLPCQSWNVKHFGTNTGASSKACLSAQSRVY